MIGLVATIAPIFMLIVVGYGFKRTGFPGDAFWPPAERLAYFVLLPALVIHNLATADLSGLQLAPLALTIVCIAAAMTALSAAARPLLGIDGPAFTSLLQGAIRLNSYLAFAVAAALWGAPGVAVAAVFVSFMMPTINVISIGALAAYGEGRSGSWRQVPMLIVTNPLIIACATGGALNALGQPAPDWVMDVLAIFGGAALALALLCVGAGLDLSVGRTGRGALATASVLKLAVMPAIAWGLAAATGLQGLTLAVVMMFAALPTSPAAYVMARQLGGDAGLMAGILTVQTVLAAITLPLVLAWTGVGMG